MDCLPTRLWMFSFCALLILCGLPAGARAQTAQAGQQALANIRCEVAISGPRSVRAAFEEFYECTDPVWETWLKKYPKEVAQLEKLYEAWKVGRVHDLRFHKSAGAWVKKHPAKFTDRSIQLSAKETERAMPLVSAEPVEVAGNFERFFIDRDNRRLFLTSDEEGLVSIRIAERYAFQLEGKVGEGGARDFFVYDSNTAFIEEPGEPGMDRDLIVLDISDRARPREVARLKGVLPDSSRNIIANSTQMQRPPTFEQYLQIREGRMSTECGRWPTVSTHPGVFCRPDQSCYKEERADQIAEASLCTRVLPQWNQMWRGSTGGEGFGRVSPRPQTVAEAGLGGMGMRGAGMQPEPGGGTGGAGSLSQMMIYGSTLYVLSSSEELNRGWLTTFDVSSPQKPQIRHMLAIDNGPEALQRHDNLLLIAGRAAVITVSLGQPQNPRLLGEFRQNCPVNRDPIVMQGSIGYRTIIISGRRRDCTSRLEVIDLSQPHQPVLRTTLAMERPRGLAVLGQRLFVADEFQGVVLFDLEDPVNPQRIGTWTLPGVKDLIVSDFDLYALRSGEVLTYYIGDLYRRGIDLEQAHRRVIGSQTVVRKIP